MTTRFLPFVFLALAGCAMIPAGQVSYQDLDSAYSPSEAAYAADGRDLAVVVRTSPFAGLTNEAVAAAVAGAMGAGPGWFRPHFTATPGADARPLYRLVFAFGVGPASGFANLCTPEWQPGGKNGRVLAAFCRGGRALSYAEAPMPVAARPGDPAFVATVRALMRALLPRRDPNADSPNNDFDR